MSGMVFVFLAGFFAGLFCMLTVEIFVIDRDGDDKKELPHA